LVQKKTEKFRHVSRATRPLYRQTTTTDLKPSVQNTKLNQIKLNTRVTGMIVYKQSKAPYTLVTVASVYGSGDRIASSW